MPSPARAGRFAPSKVERKRSLFGLWPEWLERLWRIEKNDQPPPEPLSPLRALHVDRVWPVARGAGCTVALLDSGVSGLLKSSFAALSFFDSSGQPLASPADQSGHGTACASLIASTRDDVSAVAPAASLMSVNVTGAGNAPLDSDVLDAFAFVSGKADVISCSFDLPELSQELAAAIEGAVKGGAIIVAAAGNPDNKGVEFPRRAVPPVVVVSAIDEDGAPMPGPQGPWAATAVPGAGLSSLDREGNVQTDFGQTSGATALAAGVAALMVSAAAARGRKAELCRNFPKLVARANDAAGVLDAARLLDVTLAFCSGAHS